MSRDLVICRTGKNSLHTSFISDSDRQWDLLCCPYEETKTPEALLPLLRQTDIIPGQKWSGLKTLLESWDGWKAYDYIMLADDDILSCQKNISDFFTHCHCLNAKIAQPALMSQSFFTHIITIENKNFLFRNTSFVEIMVPCFRRDILEKLLHTFSLGHTGCGWGLDNLWPKLIDFDAMFIIDDTPLLHTRPLTSQQDKEAEKKLLSELYRVTNTHNINADYIKTFSGTLRNRATIMENAPEFLGVLLSGYSDTIARTPAFALQLISRQYIKNEL